MVSLTPEERRSWVESARRAVDEAKASPKRYRLYADEVGNACLKSAANDNQRYLSLTGVILGLEYHQETFTPRLADLKKTFFGSDQCVLHRSELICGGPPFDVLKDPAKREEFDAALLPLLSSTDFCVITVLIDKRAHVERYRVWQEHPYHYCLECLLERYATWLRWRNAVGDVLFEARGKKDDKRLKKAYQHFYRRGTRFKDATALQAVLTSGEIKLKEKQDNICGLQLADLLANPCARYLQCEVEGVEMTSAYGKKVVKLLNLKAWIRKTLP